jgi:multiple sugar transport system permease protein
VADDRAVDAAGPPWRPAPRTRARLAAVAVNGLLVIGAAFTLLPLLWMISASLMPAGEALALPLRWLPSRPTLEHYAALFQRLHLGRAFLNSLFLSLAITAVSLFCNAAAGYAFAKLRFKGRDRLFAFLLATLVVPPQVGVLPLFLEIKSLGLVNSRLGVLVAGIATVFGIFLVRQFALSIPDELLDAARVDGASEMRIFVSVVLPILKPILVTLGVFTFLAAWNDFMWPLVVLTDEAKQTLPVALANLSGEHVQDTELMMAGAVITVLPVLLLFFALQKHYVEGILLGSVKE